MQVAITRQYVVAGRVQGVGYRYFVQRAARDLNVSGWVRNRSDGAVECRAFGPRDVLEDFEARLRCGPALADVRSVEVTEVKRSDKIEGFQIL